MKISKELKTGVVAILIIVLSVWGFNFVKNKSLYSSTRIFYAEYANVQGLIPTSPVTINGLRVGKVDKIEFHPEKKGILVAHIHLNNSVPFSKNSIAQIYSPDFISGKSLKIEIEMDGADLAKSGDTLKGEIDAGILGMINEQIAPLQAKVESFVINTDSVMQNLNNVLDIENQRNIKSSLKNLNATLIKFDKMAGAMDGILESNDAKIDSILNNADIAMKKFANITTSLENADLEVTLLKLKESLESFSGILDSVHKGQGTLGKLINDDALYNNLSGASKELEELLEEVKLHPKRFVHLSVFGKKEKQYQENVEE